MSLPPPPSYETAVQMDPVAMVPIKMGDMEPLAKVPVRRHCNTCRTEVNLFSLKLFNIVSGGAGYDPCVRAVQLAGVFPSLHFLWNLSCLHRMSSLCQEISAFLSSMQVNCLFIQPYYIYKIFKFRSSYGFYSPNIQCWEIAAIVILLSLEGGLVFFIFVY